MYGLAKFRDLLFNILCLAAVQHRGGQKQRQVFGRSLGHIPVSYTHLVVTDYMIWGGHEVAENAFFLRYGDLDADAHRCV